MRLMDDITKGKVAIQREGNSKDIRRFDFTGIQPFVFEIDDEQPLGKGYVDLPEGSESGTPFEQTKLVEDEFILASPFPKFSVEYDFGGFHFEGFGDLVVGCFYCEEVGVGEYHILVQLIDVAGGHSAQYIYVNSSTNSLMYKRFMSLIRDLLERLTTQKHGLVNYSGKVFLRNAVKKRAEYKPRNVIYIQSKKGKAREKTETNNKIRWQSAWLVRAHRRRLANPDSLGPNRQGVRAVKGFTWLAQYQKGDSKVPMKIRKVR